MIYIPGPAWAMISCPMHASCRVGQPISRPDVQPHVPSRFVQLVLGLSDAMSPFSRLRSALISALSPQGFQPVEQELFDQLVSNKQHILDLYHVGPQNPQERQELESGASLTSSRSRIHPNSFNR